MKLLYKTVFFFFILYSVLMVYMIFSYQPLTMETLKYCSADSDCVQTKASCCGCSEGGEDTCVNGDYLVRWENSMYEKCKGTFCAQVYNCPDASCQCINNTCIFKVQG
jgi:hypothetical protein